MQLLEFNTSDSSINLTARTVRKGPESVLLDEFVSKYKGKLGALKRHYAIFYEPLVPTGYPDMVVVSYNPKSYQSWAMPRNKLEVIDLKILHHLYFVKGSTSLAIEKQLGLNSKIMLNSLERLLDASLLRRTKQRWVPKQLKQAYGIYNIKSIEAKISNWSGAFSQAGMNQWFASESCVLSPVKKPSPQVVEVAKKSGIGIYSQSPGVDLKMILSPARINGLPLSYASWMFNEWIGRQLSKKREIAL